MQYHDLQMKMNRVSRVMLDCDQRMQTLEDHKIRM